MLCMQRAFGWTWMGTVCLTRSAVQLYVNVWPIGHTYVGRALRPREGRYGVGAGMRARLASLWGGRALRGGSGAWDPVGAWVVALIILTVNVGGMNRTQISDPQALAQRQEPTAVQATISSRHSCRHGHTDMAPPRVTTIVGLLHFARGALVICPNSAAASMCRPSARARTVQLAFPPESRGSRPQASAFDFWWDQRRGFSVSAATRDSAPSSPPATATSVDTSAIAPRRR